jgi:hypothetical protein
MKLTSILIVSSFLATSAFGVAPAPGVTKLSNPAGKTAFRKDTAAASPLFRDQALVRGGAVPGWAAYNEALDKSPLTAKACTSLVGWALGDLLSQVCFVRPRYGTNSQSSADSFSVGFGGFSFVFQIVSNHSTLAQLYFFLDRSSSAEVLSTSSVSFLLPPLVSFTMGTYIIELFIYLLISIPFSNLQIEC